MKDIRHFLKDFGVLFLSVAIAAFLGTTDAVANFLTSTQETRMIGSFVAGIFFTSIFTTAPAIVALGEIAASGHAVATAAIGALGAVLGDLVLFALIRDRLSEHLAGHLKGSRGWMRFAVLARSKSFRWFSFFIGGLIIASPFPDELGISLLGFSKMRTLWFVPLSYAFNFLGILAVGGIANVIA